MRRVIAITAAGALSLAVYWYFRSPALDRSREYLVGTDNAYPYHAIDSKGTPRGFAAELLNEAARRQGIRLRWVHSPQRATAALRAGAVDLWPALSPESKQLEPRLHLTEPWIHNDFAFVALRDEFRNLDNAAKVRRVAFRDQPNARRLARDKFPGAETLPVATREEAVAKMCAGEADGAVVELRSAYVFMATPPPACQGHPPCFVGLTFHGEVLATAARPGAEPVAEALRQEIDRMGADGTMKRILLPWSYFQSNEVTTLYDERLLRRSFRSLAIALGVSLFLLAAILAGCYLLRRANRARDKANEESWAKSRFMSKMSHELRTPLNGIVVGAELLHGTELHPEQAEYVGIIRNSGETMLRLVQDLLDLSKVVNEELPVSKQPVYLAAWLERSVLPYAHQAAAKGLRFELEVDPAIYRGPVEGDPVRLSQVLGNLLSNALKFTAEGGIRVRCSAAGSGQQVTLAISVEDTGPGIPPSRLKDLFHAAVSRPRVEDPAGGLGLGLSIASDLARQMGGQLTVESTLGKGSCFRFQVPLSTAAVITH